MTESTMVERVARALYARRPNGHGSVGGPYIIEPFEGLSHFAWSEHMAAARAAITAMREPTEQMKAMGAQSCGDERGNPDEISAMAFWEVMIHAALDKT